MAAEDFMEPEVAVTAAVTAAVFSPPVRRVIRRGLVYGMAGVLLAGDAIASFARGIGQGVQEAGTSAANAAQHTMDEARAETTRATAGAQKKATPRTATGQAKTSAEDTGGQA